MDDVSILHVMHPKDSRNLQEPHDLGGGREANRGQTTF